MAAPKLSVPRPPKPGDERDRQVIYTAPRQERRPVDERGVVRRGVGVPAKPGTPKPRVSGIGKPTNGTPRRDPGMGPVTPRPVPGRQGPKVNKTTKSVAPKGKYAK